MNGKQKYGIKWTLRFAQIYKALHQPAYQTTPTGFFASVGAARRIFFRGWRNRFKTEQVQWSFVTGTTLLFTSGR